MIEMSFQKSVSSEYLIINAISNDASIKYEELMMDNNEIEGFIDFHMRMIDEKKQYFYNVYGLKSLSDIIRQNQGDIIHLFDLLLCLKQCIQNLDEYLLEKNNLCLDEYSIFYDEYKKKYKFIYVPGFNHGLEEQLKDFFSWMMKHINYHCKSDVSLLYEVYSRLENGDNIFESVHHTEEYQEHKPTRVIEDENEDQILSCEERKNTDQCKNSRPFSGNIWICIAAVPGILAILTIFFKAELVFWYRSHSGRNLNVGWIIVGLCAALCICLCLYGISRIRSKKNSENEDGSFWKESQMVDLMSLSVDHTGVLCSEQSCAETQVLGNQKKMFLISRNTKTRILIDCLPFTIGKNEAVVQYCIDSNVISRRHVQITMENGRYYICDLHSTNGSKINDQNMVPDHLYELHDKDQITLADRTFDVILTGESAV